MTFSIQDIHLNIQEQAILKSVSLKFNIGEIHAVVGGNGAGKSSLMKVLYGSYKATSGTFMHNGDPKLNFKEDIAFVNQEVDDSLYPDLSVYDNIYAQHISRGFIYNQENKLQLEQILQSWQLPIKSDTLIKSLSISMKQMVVIIRALIQNKQLIIFDEPTASLSNNEVRLLFSEIQKIKKEVAIIFISHRIDELLTISDRISVLHDGMLIHSKPIDDWTKSTIIKAITNMDHESYTKHTYKTDRIRFEMNNISKGILNNINIKAHYGEIIGISGLVGSGKTELAEYLYKHCKKAAYIPEERQQDALVLDTSIRDNICLNDKFLLNKSQEVDAVTSIAQPINLKYRTTEQLVDDLSGGNQQKIVFLRGIYQQADIYILDEPTVGIDIGAKKDLFTQISELAKKGKTIIYFSSDFHEINMISDTIYTLYKGRIIDSRINNNITEEQLLELAVGGTA